MKLSSQEEYGLRCLLRIAREGENGSLTIPEISQAEGISSHYVAKLLGILRRAGFLTSARGQAGGYTLARPADQVVIGEVMALLSMADGFAGNDSGCMHLAGAIGIPTVGIFGSTSPARTAPLGPRTKVIYHPIECSPCLARTCRFGHYRCLTQVSAEEVAQSLEALAAAS